MNLTFYVVGVFKHNATEKTYMVQIRVLDGEQHVTEFNRPIPEADKAMWDGRVGKSSATLSLSFPK